MSRPDPEVRVILRSGLGGPPLVLTLSEGLGVIGRDVYYSAGI